MAVNREPARRRSALYRRARRIHRRDAAVVFERDRSSRRQIENIHSLRLRLIVSHLDGRASQDDVLPDDRVTGICANQDSVGVAGYAVDLDEVAGCAADNANPEIVGRLRVAISRSVV